MNEVKRFCQDCKTTRTPLWRSGPNGPRSLCNACGIKYRKRKAAEKRRNSQTSEESCSTSSTSDHQMKETLNMRSLLYNEYDPRHVIIQTPLSLSSPCSSSVSLSSSRVKKQRSRRHSINHSSETNWEFGEVEEAAFLLMSMSCDSVFA